MKTTLALILLLTGITTMAQNTFIAHRGASYLAPENTVASAKLAWELGADAVEVDVHLSKDNRVIVIHDKDTKRTCSGKTNLTIAKTPSILLRDLDAGSWKGEEFKGEKLPFLSEIIETVPEGKTLVVEIKAGGDDIIPALRRTIDNSEKIDQIVFISFGWETIINTHKEFPDNKCYWLSSIKPGIKKKMEEAAAEGLTGVNLKNSIIDEEIVAQAKDLNLEVLSWTIDNPEEAQRHTDIGVTGITTNRPKWLKEQMNQ
ncbi:glycerophosphodiester phosphodiesterase family protein [Draconibacterium sp. IB214405]|uniref:glycerophosphodiester phosphodiesterase n=1 Tax=Draconibacterium sp. IB214405 TaxID=3097352 RepID=UPI002A0DD9BF|nr:glycerophosphodiester phosphodiesterase family protein [Draconibacterium sp. IB214405]MDX8338402.1 glycerophosphodiester phosphodiesterase family protein [Draconibacterium sp. IB214405]